jgi:hypothetical protein
MKTNLFHQGDSHGEIFLKKSSLPEKVVSKHKAQNTENFDFFYEN